MNEYILRYAKEKDIPAINSLSIEMHRYMGNLVGRKFSLMELEEEKVSKSELKGIIVAEEKSRGKVIGYTSFDTKPTYDEWYGKHIYLFEICVNNKYRGKGIGKLLINKVISFAKNKKANLKVDTFFKNKNTIEFYKKLGFKPFMTYFIRENEKKLKL